MAHRKIRKNFELFSNYDYYTPGPGGILILFLLLLAGSLLGGLISAPLVLFLKDNPDAMMYATLISYTVTFIPPMIFASYKSRENSFFGKGYKLSNKHYSPLGPALCIALVMIATLSTTFISDSAISLLPPMPEWLESMLKSITQGNFLLNFLCVSIFAPFFEEWLCRGMVLRGLLQGSKIKPVWAIAISAAFFALIHMNLAQFPYALAAGLFLGAVAVSSGSFWIPFLFHLINNALSLLLSGAGEIAPLALLGALALVAALFLRFRSPLVPTSPERTCAAAFLPDKATGRNLLAAAKTLLVLPALLCLVLTFLPL